MSGVQFNVGDYEKKELKKAMDIVIFVYNHILKDNKDRDDLRTLLSNKNKLDKTKKLISKYSKDIYTKNVSEILNDIGKTKNINFVDEFNKINRFVNRIVQAEIQPIRRRGSSPKVEPPHFNVDEYVGNVIKKVARKHANKVVDIEVMLDEDKRIQKREKSEQKRIKKVADIGDMIERDKQIQKRERKDQKKIKRLLSKFNTQETSDDMTFKELKKFNKKIEKKINKLGPKDSTSTRKNIIIRNARQEILFKSFSLPSRDDIKKISREGLKKYNKETTKIINDCEKKIEECYKNNTNIKECKEIEKYCTFKIGAYGLLQSLVSKTIKKTIGKYKSKFKKGRVFTQEEQKQILKHGNVLDFFETSKRPITDLKKLKPNDDIINRVGKYHYVLVVKKKAGIIGSGNTLSKAKDEALNIISEDPNKFEGLYVIQLTIKAVSKQLLKDNKESKLKLIGGPIEIDIKYNEIENGDIVELDDHKKNNKIYITNEYLNKNTSIGQDILKKISASVHNNKLNSKLFSINTTDNLSKKTTTKPKQKKTYERKTGKVSPWIQHVKNYMNEHGVSYNRAIKESKESYKTTKETKVRKRQKNETESPWIQHVKKYMNEHGVSYKQAIKDSKSSYTKAPPKKTKRPTNKQETTDKVKIYNISPSWKEHLKEVGKDTAHNTWFKPRDTSQRTREKLVTLMSRYRGFLAKAKRGMLLKGTSDYKTQAEADYKIYKDKINKLVKWIQPGLVKKPSGKIVGWQLVPTPAESGKQKEKKTTEKKEPVKVVVKKKKPKTNFISKYLENINRNYEGKLNIQTSDIEDVKKKGDDILIELKYKMDISIYDIDDDEYMEDEIDSILLEKQDDGFTVELQQSYTNKQGVTTKQAVDEFFIYT